MSDLKHLDVAQLLRREEVSIREIGKLRGKINNEETRLSWIRTYLRQRSIKPMTLKEVEDALGYRIELLEV